jgi:adenine specific DNA methylase Mod
VYQKTAETNFYQLEHTDKGFRFEDKHINERGLYKLNQALDYDSIQYSKSLDYEIELENQKIYAGGVSYLEMIERQIKNPDRDFCWRWSKKLFEFGLENDFIVLKKYKDKKPRIYTKTYQNATIGKDSRGEYFVEIVPRGKNLSTLDLIENEYSNDNAKKELKNIFNIVKFDYPKPTSLIKILFKISTKKDSIILDFFAGSGTTAHAVMELNRQDGGIIKIVINHLMIPLKIGNILI